MKLLISDVGCHHLLDKGIRIYRSYLQPPYLEPVQQGGDGQFVGYSPVNCQTSHTIGYVLQVTIGQSVILSLLAIGQQGVLKQCFEADPGKVLPQVFLLPGATVLVTVLALGVEGASEKQCVRLGGEDRTGSGGSSLPIQDDHNTKQELWWPGPCRPQHLSLQELYNGAVGSLVLLLIFLIPAGRRRHLEKEFCQKARYGNQGSQQVFKIDQLNNLQ